MVKNFWWVRCGDADCYHRFDEMQEAFEYLVSCGVRFPVRVTQQYGIADSDSFTEMKALLEDLERAAEELRIKMEACTELESFKITIVPDDLKIVLDVVMKDGREQHRVFQRNKIDCSKNR